MRTYSYDNILDAKTLAAKLKADLPHRVVRRTGKNIQVRRRQLTYQAATIKLQPKKNTIVLRSMWDDRYMMVFILGILYFFIFTKKRKQGNMQIENEVAELLEKYHDEIQEKIA